MSSSDGVVIVCRSKAEFDEQLEKHKLVVVDFTATWCGPCRLMSPIFADFAEKMPHVAFLKVDVDDLNDVAAAYSVEAMPTFMFFKDGKVIDKVVGANKDGLRDCILKNATGATVSAA